jgi:hypothetical protein
VFQVTDTALTVDAACGLFDGTLRDEGRVGTPGHIVPSWSFPSSCGLEMGHVHVNIIKTQEFATVK